MSWRRSIRWIFPPNGPVLALSVVLLYGALVFVHLRNFGGDPSAFIAAGDQYVDAAKLPSPILIKHKSAGYDGEFYYRLALDPFTGKRTADGITLDNPATRGARIGYPLLAWAASLGHPAFLPWAMIALNLAGLAAITLLATGLATSHGLPAWRGIIVPLYPGFTLTLVRDTTEIVATAAALAALACAMRQRYWLAAAMLSCAVITRETTLFYLAGFGIVALFRSLRQRRWSRQLVPLAIPAIVFGVWQTFIAWYWGASSYSGTSQNLGVPLEGFIQYIAGEWRQLLIVPRTPLFRLHLYYFATATFVAAMIALSAAVIARRQSDPGLTATWGLYVALVVCLTTAIWVQPYDYMRACTDCAVVSAILIALSRQTWPSVTALLMVIPLWRASFWFLKLYDV
jgi:hypothetical protein